LFSLVKEFFEEYIYRAKIGNKADKEPERKVSVARAQEWCESFNHIPFLEVSSKNYDNVELAFQLIARCAISRPKVWRR